MLVYSHFYLQVIFCTTNSSSRVLARENFENSWNKTQYVRTPCRFICEVGQWHRVINMCCCISYQGQIDFPDFLMENLGIYPLNIFVAKEKSIKKLFFLLTWRAIASLKRIYGLAWNLLLIYQLKSYIYVENIMITSGQLKWKVYFCQSSIIVMEFFLIFLIFWSVGVSVCLSCRSVSLS